MNILDKLCIMAKASTLIAITTFMISLTISMLDFVLEYFWGDDE